MNQPRVDVDHDYTGHVSPGSDAQARNIPGASIVKMSVGTMDNNVYLVQCSSSGKSVLIDAAADAARIERLIDEHAGELQSIVTTHRHPDHWQALAAVADKTGVPTAAHPLDADPLPVMPDRLLNDGDSLPVGELAFEVIHLSGHTPGSIALALTESDGRTHLFTGDSLF
ncbi:MAG: MBL fold metallo-hydrolase, partial [Rhodococcus fascians]